MEENNISTRFLSTRTNDKCVSTIRRRSSCASYPTWFYETIVWSLKEDGSPNNILEQDGTHGDGRDCAFSMHNEYVKKIVYNLPLNTEEY